MYCRYRKRRLTFQQHDVSQKLTFLSDEEPALETLGFLYIGSTPTFLYFDFYLNTAYAVVCIRFKVLKY